jgi:hypothetical protein
MINFEPRPNCQYNLSSYKHKWWNTFQQGVDIFQNILKIRWNWYSEDSDVVKYKPPHIRGSLWYIIIKLWNIYNGKIYVVFSLS